MLDVGAGTGRLTFAAAKKAKRVTKNGGWLVLCSGDDPSYTPDPFEGLLSLGFEWRKHDCVCREGVVYDYFKQVKK